MTAMRRLFVLAILAVAASCGPPGIVLPDAGDDGPDAEVGMAGLEFQWSAPDLGTPLGDVVIRELRMWLRDIRAVGDASPGNETYRPMQEIRLDGTMAPRIVFPAAPPGRYAALEFELARDNDGDDSFRIRGDCTLDSETYDLEVDDEAPLSVSLPLDLVLAPGETRIVHIEVALDLLVAGIDWSQGEIDDGDLTVDNGSPLLDDLRANLLAAISIASVE